MNRWTKSITLVAAVLSATACNDNPTAGDAAVKTGSLGNGGFVFQCDDGVECRHWASNDAETFPKDGIALGATFRMRFIKKEDFGTQAADLNIFSDRKTSEGVVLRGIPPYFGGTPGDRILAQGKAGFGTIVAQTTAGGTFDFISLQVVKPDKLAVLDADYTGSGAAPELALVKLKVGGAKNLRVVAEAKNRPLAGSIPADWRIADAALADVSNVSDGVAKIVASAAGTTTLKVTGAAFETTITLEVTP